MIEDKISKFLNEESLKLIPVTFWWSLDLDDNETFYTYTDGKGNYPLAKDGSIFVGEKNNKNIKDLDGKPHSKSKKVFVAKLNNVFGLYDGNFKLVKKFKDIDDLAEDLKDTLESGKKIPYDFEEFSVGKDYSQDFEDYMKGDRF